MTLKIDLHKRHEENLSFKGTIKLSNDTEQNMTEQIYNGTNSNVIRQDYIMEATEFMEFVVCFTIKQVG